MHPPTHQTGFTAIPAKKRGKASLFLCCAKATLLLAPKGGEPRSPPLESPIAKCSAGTAAGFTLIELIMTILILAIISTVISKFLIQVYQSFIVSQNIAETDWSGLITLDRLTNDIHNIRSADSITTISSQQLSATSMDGSTVQYQVSGSTLLRNGIVLASGLQNFSLTYKDEDNNVTTTPALIRYIAISATFTQNNITSSFTTLAGTRGMP
ncbi:MAG: hypothetical protein A3E85_03425 [Gammaproteobacteria bacterium RIFCSPHIGHO2_12_FULL_45_12]|nr:MAG: hypothetical protein A3E85_03425 [Gammaproteobacteria bacterium RIFCSPHIGHO2_12_FULL_45_12]